MLPTELTQSQFFTVYNLLSLVIAAQLSTTVFLLVVQQRVLPRYRQALVVGATVCGIAAYHYFRIFDSFNAAYVNNDRGGVGIYAQAIGRSFNEGYRYVDWLLTVPLLLLELIAVLGLATKVQRSLLGRLIPAAALMIILGYPGEISTSTLTRIVFGILSTIPFLYILYVLFAEVTRSLVRQTAEVRTYFSRLRVLLLVTWLVYPLAYLIPILGIAGSDAWVIKQAGYSFADILSKALYGLFIYRIARLKSFDDDPGFALSESSNSDAPPEVAVERPRAAPAGQS